VQPGPIACSGESGYHQKRQGKQRDMVEAEPQGTRPQLADHCLIALPLGQQEVGSASK